MILKFGKHQGEDIYSVIVKDAKYVKWLLEKNIVVFKKEDALMIDEILYPSDRKIWFGKHKGITYEELLQTDMDYAKWMYLHKVRYFTHREIEIMGFPVIYDEEMQPTDRRHKPGEIEITQEIMDMWDK